MENINTSFPDDGLGDKVRNAFIKVNNNFTELNQNKVDKVTGKGLSDENYSTSEKGLVATIVNKVDKVTGKGLSTNDYDNTEKAKVAFALQTSQIGQPLGVAGLDGNGQVPSVNLPSYVIEVADLTALNALPPSEKMSGKIYITLDTNKSYRWSGSVFVYITSGAVDSVAGKTGTVTLVKADVGLPLADNTADATKNVLSATKLTTARTINGVAFNGTSNITIVDATKEPVFSKNTGFNKDFGTTADTVAQGSHTHTFGSLISKPTTLSGYGITDAGSLEQTTITTSRIASPSDNGKLIKIKGNATYTINQSELPTGWNVIVRSFTGATGTFVASAGTTFDAPTGLILKPLKMCSIIKDSDDNKILINGETSLT